MTAQDDVIGRFKAAVENLATATQHSVDKTQGILRELTGAKIVLHTTADWVGGYYLTAKVSGDYAGLYRLITGKK